MKYFLFAFLCLAAPYSVFTEEAPLFQSTEGQRLIIHNRVLTQVHGKTISVIDLVKRMDLFLQKHYPEVADSAAIRHQFFSSQWKHYLNQMVEAELMLIDAERLEIKITDAEVREEILNRFGPNVMPTLDKAGLSYEEARQLVHDELVVQRIQWFRVNSKALSQINSKDVKVAYQHYLEKNAKTDDWEYQVLSIRPSNPSQIEALSASIATLIPSCQSLTELGEKVRTGQEQQITVSLSEDLKADNQTLSSSHYQILKTLHPGSYSDPIPQLSRSDGSSVLRIFYLKKHTVTTPASFEKMAEELKSTLLQEAAMKENERYLLKLKQQLGYEDSRVLESIPSDFQPFALR